MSDNENEGQHDPLEMLGTELLKLHGFGPNGQPKGKRPRKIYYQTMDPRTLESLRQVRGVGGAIHRCTLGNRPADPDVDASDAPDNELTLVHHLLEE